MSYGFQTPDFRKVGLGSTLPPKQKKRAHPKNELQTNFQGER